MASKGPKRKASSNTAATEDPDKRRKKVEAEVEEPAKNEGRRTRKRTADIEVQELKANKKSSPLIDMDDRRVPNGNVTNGNGCYDSDEDSVDDKYFPIAIVGIGCRMPGDVNCPQDFQRVMEEGIDVVSEVPADRWDLDKYWHPDPHNVGTHANRRAGFCKNVHDFDHTFYNISPREAANMDVMHRNLLEVTQEAFDDGGIPSEKLPKDTGVYIGLCLMDHGFTVIEDAKCMNAYTHTGTAHSVAANRVSFHYDIRGPSVCIDTACAASLTAMHYACWALWNGECPVAIVGASNTLMVPEVTVGFNALGVLSAEGISCPFSANAKGYVRSEGTGVMIMKPLKAALRDGDHIYCTTRASWLAHNGFSLSITMPSTDAQAEMMRKTYEVFGLDPDSVDFVEAHGTGTPVGDPLEADGVARAFTIGNKNRKKPLMIGSSKSNFGHMEGAAGMVQVLKTALMLEQRKVFPNINYGEPNPAIDIEGWNIRVPTEVEQFKENKTYRIGVNTFGFGGALAHMIFDEHTGKQPETPNKGSAGWQFGNKNAHGKKLPITLSAKSGAALKDYCKSWMEFESPHDAEEVTCWLASRRSHYTNRLVVFADSSEDFREKLQMYVDKVPHDEIVEGTLPAHVDEKQICFVFPGQGQQTFNMGRSLYAEEPVFRKAVDECDAIYKKLSGKSFMKTYNLFSPLEPGKKYNEDIVNEIQVSQPAILYLQVGLFHLMEHWGIKPDALVGHSLGEVAAAYASGAVNLEEAVTVQYHRAEQQVKLDGTGSMAALRVSPEEGEKMCKKYKDLYVACTNAHESITIAGSKPVVKEICADNPGNAKELRVKCAFHTPHMDPLHEEFMKAMKGKLRNGKPNKSAWYSTVTGGKYEGAATAQYFWDNIRSRVQFLDAVRGVMQNNPNTIFLELAGAATLLSSIRAIAKGEEYAPAGMVGLGQRQKDDRISTMRGIATLHTMGIELDWQNALGNCGKWMRLPLYAWQHSTFRYEAEGMRMRRLDLEDRTYKGLHGKVRLEQLQFLRDHVINGKTVFPKSGLVEYMMQMHYDSDEIPVLSNVKLNPEFIVIPEEVDCNGESPERKQLDFERVQIPNGTRLIAKCDDIIYAQADIIKTGETEAQRFDLEKLKAKCRTVLGADELYEKFAEVGVDYADDRRFKAIEQIHIGDGESVATLQHALDKRERIHTIVLDAAMTASLATKKHFSSLLVPTEMGTVRMYVPQMPRKVPLFVYTRLTHCDSMGLSSDMYIFDEEGKVLVEVTGFTAENLNGSTTKKLDLNQCIYTTEWQPVASCLPPTSVMKEFMSAENMWKRYPTDMASIETANKYARQVKEICVAYAKHAVNSVPEKDVNPKVERYATRLRQMRDTMPTTMKFDEISKAIAQIERACPEYHQEMKMIECMGRILAETLKDPKVALTELFQEEMMGKYFLDSITVNIYYKAIADTVRMACDEALKSKKIVRVAEIGGRLGGLSVYILAAIKDLLEKGVVEFCFTDINVAFFSLVQEKVKEYPNVRLQQLDIERDIKTQSFVANCFDVVVCLDTLHCTENAVEASSNMRDLLCKDGWAILMESTNNQNTPEIIFGAFDLCWIFEDQRKDRCWMSQAGWSDVLVQAGYSDVVAMSTPNEFYHSIIVGRKTEMSLNYPKYHEEEQVMEVDGEAMWTVVHLNEGAFANSIKSKLSGSVTVTTAQKFKNSQKSIADHDGPVNIVYIWNESDIELSETLNVIQQCQALGEKSGCTLYIVTRNSNMDSQNPDHGSVIGFLRSACSEVKNIALYLIDLENSGSNNQVRDLVSIFNSHTHNDREISVRGSTQFVPRIIRHPLQSKIPIGGDSWCVEALSKKENRIDTVDFHKCMNEKPGPNQVRILVRAVPVNREDIKASQEEARRNKVKLGIECAGIIDSVGSNVNNLIPSLPVIAFSDNCLASSIVVDVGKVFKKPRALTMLEAAGSSMAYASAYYALISRANLKKNETILIHSACGGVGQASIELAKHVGAKVICTTSTDEKRAYLKGQCGITHVSDSRSRAFCDDVMNWTDGHGVDVVVNFLGGDVLDASMASLSHGGRLCQLGDKDVFKSTHLVMEALSKNISLHLIQLDELMNENPSMFRTVVESVIELLDDRSVNPVPATVSDICEFKNTLSDAAGENVIGRMVIDIPPAFCPELVEPASNIFRSDATYLLTGSTGGIGQELARWMVDRGARHIALVSKTGHKTWFQKSTVSYMEEQGATVYEVRGDISREKDVKDTFRLLTQNGNPPIRGVFHLAGINEDTELESLTQHGISRELKVKAQGAKLLHEVTKDMNLQLDYFVMFSSSKATWGNPTLGAFCAACHSLDVLAEKRRSDGLPALSVQCGWMRGAGWIENRDRSARLEQFHKDNSLHVHEFLSLLHKVITNADNAPVVMIANEDWDDASEASYKDSLLFRHYASSSGKRKGGSDLSKDDLEKKMVDKLGALLMMAPEDIDVAQPMIHYGVDSLISLDITNWMRKEFNLMVNQMDILEGMTTLSLIEQVLD